MYAQLRASSHPDVSLHQGLFGPSVSTLIANIAKPSQPLPKICCSSTHVPPASLGISCLRKLGLVMIHRERPAAHTDRIPTSQRLRTADSFVQSAQAIIN